MKGLLKWPWDSRNIFINGYFGLPYKIYIKKNIINVSLKSKTFTYLFHILMQYYTLYSLRIFLWNSSDLRLSNIEYSVTTPLVHETSKNNILVIYFHLFL